MTDSGRRESAPSEAGADAGGSGSDPRPTVGSSGTGGRRFPSVSGRTDLLREAFISGLAVVVPALVTLAVLLFVFNAVYRYLDLVSDVATMLRISAAIPFLSEETFVELVAPVVLVAVVFVVGMFVTVTRSGELIVDYFDEVVARIPGVGSVYDSFRQMSDVMIESDAGNFREVKLVEFPHEGAYTLGFVTTRTPESLQRPTGHEDMLTLFLPLAPNPVMGGHLVHVPADRVMDVDMSVEEGLRAVVTSGVAVAGGDRSDDGLSERRLRELATADRADRRLDPTVASSTTRHATAVDADRSETYDERVAPDHASTPDDIVRREREENDGVPDVGTVPAERAGRDASARDETERRPAELAGRNDGDDGAGAAGGEDDEGGDDDGGDGVDDEGGDGTADADGGESPTNGESTDESADEDGDA